MTAMGICSEAGAGLYSPNQVTREFATVGLRDGVKHLYVLLPLHSLDKNSEMIL